MGYLQHPAHEHALSLRLLSEDFIWKMSYRCEMCGNKLQAGSAYCCEECSEFFLHKSCAELPSDVQHPFHQQHPLKMFVDPQKYPRPKECDVCERGNSLAYFDCSDCGNRFCCICVINNMPGEDSHTRPADDSTAHHFTHHHPLKSFYVGMSWPVVCWAVVCRVCQECIEEGEAYACYKCRHFLHKNCAEFSQELRHPFHPEHPLTLLSHLPNGSKCNACRRSGSAYSCGQCQFNLHLDCAISTMEFELLEDRGLFMDHFSHQHRLKSFIVKMKCKIQCDACQNIISGETYGCADCMFFVHKSCTQAPSKVEHPLHEEHSLSLVPKSAYGSTSLECSICNGSISYYAFAFICQEACEFVLDVKCALETLSYLKQGRLAKIERRLHDHPLQLCLRKGGTSFCELCYKLVRGLAYECSLEECKIWLHRSCADFPVEMQHPSHPQHTLTFHSDPRTYRCSACFTLGYERTGFFCAECNFTLDFGCASRNLTFKHPLHEHSLSHFRQIQVYSQGESQTSSPRDYQTSSPRDFQASLPWASPCKACGKRCGVDLYRCVQCNFNIHTDCLQQLQLPPKIKHRKHFHQLTLADSFVEDDWGDYSCEFCGKDRDVKLGVYYCEECPREYTLIAHIECVIDKIPEKLKTEARLAIARLDKEIKSLQAQVDAVDQELDAVAKELDALTKRRAALDAKVDEVKRERERLL